MDTNGHLSSLDITREIVAFLFEDPLMDEDERELSYVHMRSTCRLWRNLSDDQFRFKRGKALAGAMRRANRHSIVFLLPRMKSPEDRYDYAIRLACDEGYTEAVKILLDLPQIDPANKDNYCIQWASFHGHNDIVGEITLTIVYNVVD